MAPDALAEVLLASCRAAMPNGTVMEIDDVKIPAERILPAFAGEVAQPEDEKERQFAPLVARLNDGEWLDVQAVHWLVGRIPHRKCQVAA